MVLQPLRPALRYPNLAAEVRRGTMKCSRISVGLAGDTLKEGLSFKTSSCPLSSTTGRTTGK